MKRKFFVALLMSILLLQNFSNADGVLPTTVSFNGNYIVGAEPKIVDSRTLIPLRVVAEAMNADVKWNSSKKEAVIIKSSTKLVFGLNKKSFIKNGDTKSLDVAPKFINNKIYLPVRAISEALDVKTNWDEKRRIVNLGETLDYSKLYDNYPENVADIIYKYSYLNTSDDMIVGNWISKDDNNLSTLLFIQEGEELYDIVVFEYNKEGSILYYGSGFDGKGFRGNIFGYKEDDKGIVCLLNDEVFKSGTNHLPSRILNLILKGESLHLKSYFYAEKSNYNPPAFVKINK